MSSSSSLGSSPPVNAAGSAATTQSVISTPTPVSPFSYRPAFGTSPTQSVSTPAPGPAFSTPAAGSLFGTPTQSVAFTPIQSSVFGTPRASTPSTGTSLFGFNSTGSAATPTQSVISTPTAGPLFGTSRASVSTASAATASAATSSVSLEAGRAPPEKTVSIVDNGDCDILLEVSDGKTTIQYEVNSIFLTTHSAVFKKMFGRESNFSEAAAVREAQSTGKPALITLEDDPIVMGFILYALHGKHTQVPRELTLKHLTQAAIICDKYCLHEVLKLISEHWTSKGSKESILYPTEWLFISWIFGPEYIFTATSRTFILQSSLCINTLVLGGACSGQTILLEATPQIIANSIKSRRFEYLAVVQKSVARLQKKYSGKDLSLNGIKLVHCIARKEYCDAMQLGIIHRFLVNLEPRTLADYDISELCSRIEKLPRDWIIPPAHEGGYTGLSHVLCSWIPAFVTEHKKAMEDIKGLTFAEFPSRTWG